MSFIKRVLDSEVKDFPTFLHLDVWLRIICSGGADGISTFIQALVGFGELSLDIAERCRI